MPPEVPPPALADVWDWDDLGMTQHDAGDLEGALESLEAALALREARGQVRGARLARWMVTGRRG